MGELIWHFYEHKLIFKLKQKSGMQGWLCKVPMAFRTTLLEKGVLTVLPVTPSMQYSNSPFELHYYTGGDKNVMSNLPAFC